jgi:G:T/U-mismatch repair DNA glycosylase
LRRGALVGLHVLVALPLYQANLASVRRFENGSRALISAVQPARTVVLVNTPMELVGVYALTTLDRAETADRSPRALHQL